MVQLLLPWYGSMDKSRKNFTDFSLHECRQTMIYAKTGVRVCTAQ